MQRINQAIRIWIKTKKIRLAQIVFNYLFKDPLSGMKDILDSAVNQRTIANIMNWMDYKMIRHCHFCPSTDELKKHPLGYMCKRHFDMSDEPAVVA